jgi:hypothetical protein
MNRNRKGEREREREREGEREACILTTRALCVKIGFVCVIFMEREREWRPLIQLLDPLIPTVLMKG